MVAVFKEQNYIPQRQILCDHTEVRKRAKAVVQRNLKQLADDFIKKLKFK